jgi:hypothetical protein
MMVIVTQALPVSRVFYSASYSNKISFILSPLLAPLFTQTIECTRVADNQVASSITRGDASRGGKVVLDLNPANFDALVRQRTPSFSVILSYEDVTLRVVQLELVRDPAAVTGAAVQRLVITLEQSAA